MDNNTSGNNILPQELENCNFVKTVLMLIVVFYHSILFWNGDWFTKNPAIESKFLAYLSQWLNSFHIYAFTLVSGYIFYYLKFEKGKYNNFKQYAISKFKRLIVPYFCVSCIWIIPFNIFAFKNMETSQIIEKFALGTSPSQLWFLLMLFNIFIIVYPLATVFKNKVKTSVLIVVGIYLFGFIFSKYSLNYYQLRTSCRFLLFFFIGFQIRNLKLNLYRIPWYIYLIVNLLLYYTLIVLEPENSICASIVRFVLQIEGSFASFVILQQLANYSYWDNKVFKFYSCSTMTIYLFHQQIICLTVLAFNGLVTPLLHGCLNFIIAILISSVITYFLLKYNFTRFLVGEK